MKERFSRRDLFKLGAGALLMAGGISYPIANEIRNRDLEKRVRELETVDRLQNRLVYDATKMSVLAIVGVEVDHETFDIVSKRGLKNLKAGKSEWDEDFLLETDEEIKLRLEKASGVKK